MFDCGPTWKMSFWTSNNVATCVMVPDHCMQAVGVTQLSCSRVVWLTHFSSTAWLKSGNRQCPTIGYTLPVIVDFCWNQLITQCNYCPQYNEDMSYGIQATQVWYVSLKGAHLCGNLSVAVLLSHYKHGSRRHKRSYWRSVSKAAPFF